MANHMSQDIDSQFESQTELEFYDFTNSGDQPLTQTQTQTQTQIQTQTQTQNPVESQEQNNNNNNESSSNQNNKQKTKQLDNLITQNYYSQTQPQSQTLTQTQFESQKHFMGARTLNTLNTQSQTQTQSQSLYDNQPQSNNNISLQNKNVPNSNNNNNNDSDDDDDDDIVDDDEDVELTFETFDDHTKITSNKLINVDDSQPLMNTIGMDDSLGVTVTQSQTQTQTQSQSQSQVSPLQRNRNRINHPNIDDIGAIEDEDPELNESEAQKQTKETINNNDDNAIIENNDITIHKARVIDHTINEDGDQEEEDDDDDIDDNISDSGSITSNTTSHTRASSGTSISGSTSVSTTNNNNGQRIVNNNNNNRTSTPYDFNNLPSHHCQYCGIHDPACVVKCDTCNKWFCNSRRGAAGSHIIHHLVRSKHKFISLHEDGPVGETSLECYNCGTRNVFLLGFVQAKDDDAVVLLCRDTCVHLPNLKDLNWYEEAWQPLIRDRELLDWMVQSPNDSQLLKARIVTSDQMNKLEILWKQKTTINAKLEDLENREVERHVNPVKITYEDGKDFEAIFSPLIELEADYDRIKKESQAQSDVIIAWDLSLGRKRIVHFHLNRGRGEQELRVAKGDELRLKYPGDNNHNEWEITGVVLRVAPNHEIAQQLQRRDAITGNIISTGDDTTEIITMKLNIKDENNESRCQRMTEITEGWRIEFVWKPTSYQRMKDALKTFYEDKYSVTAYLYHLLMGHEVVPQKVDCIMPTKFSAPGLPELNHSQMNAVKHCLQSPLSLIQGPPGTGKTVTSATIIYHLVKQSNSNLNINSNIAVNNSQNNNNNNNNLNSNSNINDERGGQVLVCAPSNIAVDQLTLKIHQTGLKVVRMTAKSREEVSNIVDFVCLHNLVLQVAKIEDSKLYKLHLLKEKMGELKENDNDDYKKEWKETEMRLLTSADVICTTCVGAGDRRLSQFRFKQILIDESTQAKEPECFIPIVMGAKQIVLVGDHCQLGPVVLCKQAAQAGFARSLFERLVLLRQKPFRLQVQYRMHPSLSEFASNTFYEGSLQNGVTQEDRSLAILSKFWPNSNVPMFFYCSIGREEFAATGTSYLNRMEAQNVEKIITKLIQLGMKPHQIGVITPYQGQRQYIEGYMQRKGTLKATVYERVEVASVDAFQGREKDIIILSCVRSNNKQGIGFLNDPRRLNVAITRAKYGLIIVGNPSVLSKQILWNNLLSHFKQHGLLVEGSLNNLKQSMIHLSKPKKYYNGSLSLMPVIARFGPEMANLMAGPMMQQQQQQQQNQSNQSSIQMQQITNQQQLLQQQQYINNGLINIGAQLPNMMGYGSRRIPFAYPYLVNTTNIQSTSSSSSSSTAQMMQQVHSNIHNIQNQHNNQRNGNNQRQTTPMSQHQMGSTLDNISSIGVSTSGTIPSTLLTGIDNTGSSVSAPLSMSSQQSTLSNYAYPGMITADHLGKRNNISNKMSSRAPPSVPPANNNSAAVMTQQFTQDDDLTLQFENVTLNTQQSQLQSQTQSQSQSQLH